MPGTWTTFSTPAIGSSNLVADTMLLLTDGSVLVHQVYVAASGSLAGIDGSVWMRLTPDSAGNYATGTWTGPFRMANQREYFASGITADGRVYVLGGEFSNDFVNADTNGQFTGNDTPLGEVFDPGSNGWSPTIKPASFTYIRGDVASSGLADGRVIFGSLTDSRSAIWDPDDNAWLESGKAFGTSTETKDSGTNEETWTLLPDGSVLTVEISPAGGRTAPNPAERYVPASDTWVAASGTPQSIVLTTINCTYTPAGGTPQAQTVIINEIGPAILMGNGSVFAIGGNGNNAIYNPSTNTWSKGPQFNADTSGNSFTDSGGNTCTWTSPTGFQGAADAPAVLLPGGQVLCCAGSLRPAIANNLIQLNSAGTVNDFFNIPTTLYEYDPAHPGLVPLPNQPSINTNFTWTARMLLLPNGQVLFSANTTTFALYQPSANELSPVVSAPAITNAGSAEFPAVLITGHSYTITGSNLNGFSQANSYGDDVQMATNFPLVRATNTAANQVVYFPTGNFTSSGVAVSGATSCDVRVPFGLATGQWSLVVIANAIASAPVTVQIANQDVLVYMDTSILSYNEIKAMLQQNSNNPVTISDLLHVVIEGFSQNDIVQAPSIPDPSSKTHIKFAGPYLPENPALPANAIQRFTFVYNITFDDNSIFASAPTTLALTATSTPKTGSSVIGAGFLQLTRNPVPFILHGDAKEKWVFAELSG